jgi:hypothetical protein
VGERLLAREKYALLSDELEAVRRLRLQAQRAGVIEAAGQSVQTRVHTARARIIQDIRTSWENKALESRLPNWCFLVLGKKLNVSENVHPPLGPTFKLLDFRHLAVECKEASIAA